MYREVIANWLDEAPVRRAVVRWLYDQQVEAYLVGGSVRDALMGRVSSDMDIVMAGHAMHLARRLADAVRGAYVPLDAARDVARIVVWVCGGHQHIDVSGLRAEDILGDLAARDFSINAMALRLGAGEGDLLDPTGGQADLKARVLRVISPMAFQQDPLRVLRAIRLRSSLGCAVEPETEALARAWAPALRDVSSERLRDELYQILMQPDATGALAYARHLGALTLLLPEVLEAQQSEALARLNLLEEVMAPSSAADDARHLAGLVAPMQWRWQEDLSEGRPAMATLKLGCVLSVVAPEADLMAKVAWRLRLSNSELRCLEAVARAMSHDALQPEPTPLAPLTMYEYYRAVGEAGLDGVALALVLGLRGMRTGVLAIASQQALERRAQQLISAWFNQQAEIVSPPTLITGADVMRLLALRPGPQVGYYLELVRRAQVDGRIHTPTEASALLQTLV